MSNSLHVRGVEQELIELGSDDRNKATGEAKFTFIDLFAGIGGFHLGMKANGGECVFTSEWDKYAATTYREWHKGHQVNSEDIRELDYETQIPDHDVLLAGFPCQPFSIAGVSKKNSLGRMHGFQDELQGNLFFSIAEIARIKRPPIMLLENVKNLRSHDKGNTWRIISETLDSLNYSFVHKVIDAKHWVPQHRERIFIACFDDEAFTPEEVSSFSFPEEPSGERKLAEILETKPPDEKYMLSDGLWEYLKGYALKHKAKGNGFGYQLVGPEDISRTMSARYYKDGSEILIDEPSWRNPRKLTPAEASRLMGFNSRFARLAGHDGSFPQVVSDVQSYKQFGNSVSPPVVEAIGKELLKILSQREVRLGNFNSSTDS